MFDTKFGHTLYNDFSERATFSCVHSSAIFVEHRLAGDFIANDLINFHNQIYF
jgi:hypothetical protein